MTKYAPNRPVIMVLVVILVVVTALFLFKSQIQKPEDYSYPSEPVSAPPQAGPEVTSQAPELVIGTFPPGSKPIDVSIEEVKGAKTITASWDNSDFEAFYLILFDAEFYSAHSPKMVVWALSSLKQGGLPANGIVTKEDVTGTIPSGHTLGQAMQGLQNSPAPAGGTELTVGRKYILQLSGFTKEGNVVHVNKEFTYT